MLDSALPGFETRTTQALTINVGHCLYDVLGATYLANGRSQRGSDAIHRSQDKPVLGPPSGTRGTS